MNDNRAWGDFWDLEANRTPGRKGGGGILGAYAAIDDAQRKIWGEFAQMLPRNARVLDLATGDGRVMTYLLAARRDLKPVGTDSAPRLPDAPRGTSIKAGVPMEELPFPDKRFAAVTSQFGFEYSDMALAASEIERVLAGNGIVALLMHRPDSPILAHNLARREQIEWAMREKNVIALAQRHLQMRATGLSAIPSQLRSIAQEGHSRFGSGSAAWEIPEAVAQTLELGSRDDAGNVAALLRQIADRAANELGRIASLERACRQGGDVAALDNAFRNAGLEVIRETDVQTERDSEVFATFRVLKPIAR